VAAAARCVPARAPLAIRAGGRSEACRVRHTRRPTEPRPPRPVVCGSCGETFHTTGRATYCSEPCARAGAKQRRQARRRKAKRAPTNPPLPAAQPKESHDA
jgi:hypothetical protein